LLEEQGYVPDRRFNVVNSGQRLLYWDEQNGRQLDVLSRAMQEAPKSTGWKLRARIGERKRWYDLPEEARA
jgi:hypothetical protein